MASQSPFDSNPPVPTIGAELRAELRDGKDCNG